MRQAGFSGRIVMVGDEPWRPYERPPLSKAALTDPALPEPQYFHAESKYAELGVEIMRGVRAEAIDVQARRVRLGDGTPLPFERLLIATGGRARQLTIPGAKFAHTLRTYDEAKALRGALAQVAHVVCIGAGVIGLEIASSARKGGAAVTVLEAAALPMGRCVSREGAEYIDALHKSNGVEIRYGIGAAAIEQAAGNMFRVVASDGSHIECGLVVAAVGMERNDQLARDAGIATANGILVDETGQSSIPGIYAAGDVAAFKHADTGKHVRLESWQHAQNHGVTVGKTMAGTPTRYDDIPWFWTDQHGVNFQVLGLPAEAARTVVRPRSDASPFTCLHLSEDGTICGMTAANNPRDIRAGKTFVKQKLKADPALVADPAVPFQKIAVR
jgi:3-phenylpropionate/trans-cinnamate dioxygenase ferredoxin reductase subunit